MKVVRALQETDIHLVEQRRSVQCNQVVWLFGAMSLWMQFS